VTDERDLGPKAPTVHGLSDGSGGCEDGRTNLEEYSEVVSPERTPRPHRPVVQGTHHAAEASDCHGQFCDEDEGVVAFHRTPGCVLPGESAAARMSYNDPRRSRHGGDAVRRRRSVRDAAGPFDSVQATRRISEAYPRSERERGVIGRVSLCPAVPAWTFDVRPALAFSTVSRISCPMPLLPEPPWLVPTSHVNDWPPADVDYRRQSRMREHDCR